MEIFAASQDLRERYAQEIPELVWATGPVSYEYHFADRICSMPLCWAPGLATAPCSRLMRRPSRLRMVNSWA